MANRNGWVGFVNIELTTADKKTLKEKLLSADEWLDWAGTQMMLGYKISQAWDDERSCWVVTMTANSQDNENYGYSMSQRHSELIVALTALVYAHDTKADGAWASYDKVKQQKFNW